MIGSKSKTRLYRVAGFLKKGSNTKRFRVKVYAKTAKEANNLVKDIVRDYCAYMHTNKEGLECVINKRTLRIDR